MNEPRGVALDAAGNLYIADTGNNRIRRVAANGGAIGTVAGNGQAVALNSPFNVAVDAANKLYIADTDNHRIRKVSPTGVLTTIAGVSDHGFEGDGGPAVSALLSHPEAVAVDASLNVYIADTDNARVRRISALGFISTAAGNGNYSSTGDDGPALSATFRKPTHVAIDGMGNTYVADYEANRLRKISPEGIITTVAGDGVPRFAGDGGPATSASLQSPIGVAAAPDGTLYISDSGNRCIRKVAPDGTISRFAGTALGVGSTEDGVPALSAYLDFPTSIALSPSGDLYMADLFSGTVRKVSPSGIITTVAGNGGTTSSGDGGPATRASLERPTDVALDAAGNVYITEMSRVRKVSTDGIITTVAGTGVRAYSGDNGPATAASLYDPSGVIVSSSGALLIADTENNRIRQVANNTITTVIGDGVYRLLGDGGPAQEASVAQPQGMAYDAQGNLYIADTGNRRIRRVLSGAPSFGVGPASLEFSAAATGAAQAPLNLNISTPFSGTPFQLAVATSDGGSWLAANALGGILPATVQIFTDLSGLDPGVYRGTITVRVPGASPSTRIVNVTLTIGQVEPPRPGADPAGFAYAFTVGSDAESRQLVVSNRGGGALSFSASAAVDSRTPWLSVTPQSGAALAVGPASLTVTANPQGLAAGTYSGRISITSPNAPVVTIPVTMTVAAAPQTILLSQSGLTFTAVVGGGAPPSQNFGVLNIGQGVMQWTAESATLSGGPQWLSVNPASGSTDVASLTVPLVDVAVNHAGLAPGDHYGQIQVRSISASNTPQTVSVVLTVLPAGSDPGPLVRPTGLIFTALAGSSAAAQEIQVSNLTASASSFISGRLSDNPGNLFDAQPANATVTPGQPTRITVQLSIATLQPQVYRGTLTLQFADGTPRTVGLLFVVVGGGSAAAKTLSRRADACVPSRVLPIFTSLPSDFAAAVAWPLPLEARVIDDCGVPMTSGTVVASFSNGDPPLPMASLKDGRWSGTWHARNASAGRVVVTLNAAATLGELRGTTQISGSLRPNPDPPIVSPGGVISSVGPSRVAPVAPGSLISILGSRLANAQSSAPSPPLPEQLDVTRVLMGGRLLPLSSVRTDQIDAQVPYDMPVNARYSLIVERAATGSSPEELTIAPAQPVIFTSDRSGTGQGLVYHAGADGAQGALADAQDPLRAGDRLLIRCAGLGAVTPSVTAGVASGQQVTVVSPVGLQIGGVDATVTSAGLAPGQVGVYQVLATMPAGGRCGRFGSGDPDCRRTNQPDGQCSRKIDPSAAEPARGSQASSSQAGVHRPRVDSSSARVFCIDRDRVAGLIDSSNGRRKARVHESALELIAVLTRHYS